MERIIYNKDVSTGKISTGTDNPTTYSSEGPPNATVFKNEVIPVNVLQVCYTLNVNDTCTDDQKRAIANGTAAVREYMVVDKNSTSRYPEIVGYPDGRPPPTRRGIKPEWRLGQDLAFGATGQDPQEWASWAGLAGDGFDERF